MIIGFLTGNFSISQNTPTTITMDAGTNNDTAFGTQGTIATSVTTFYAHWDANFIYIGWKEGRTNYSSDLYYVAFDTDPNTASGTSNSIEGVGFQAGNSLPDYYLVYENNVSFYGAPVSNGNAIELYDGTSGSWNFVSRTGGNDNTSSRVDFQDAPNGEVRVRIAWSALGFTRGVDKPIGITFWTNNSSGNFMWSRFPNSNPGTGATPKTLTHQIIFNSTGDGINPSTSFYENALSNNITYTSLSDSNWSGLTTWQNGGLPSAGSSVIVDHAITSDVNSSVGSVTVNPGKSLVINSGITLTTTDGIVLNSQSDSYSSLILYGTITGAVQYNRHVNGNSTLGDTNAIGDNDLISPPVSGQTFGAFATANPNLLENPGDATEKAFAPFDKTTGDYENYDTTTNASTTLDAGVGYRAATDDTSTLTFSGTVNTGLVTHDIVNSGPAFAPWNLIGNPYPSYILARDFLEHEVDTGVRNIDLFHPDSAAIYGYDGDVDGGSGYTIYNLATTDANTVIAPGQGFLVSANPSTTPVDLIADYDVEFTPAIRTTGTDDDFILGRGSVLINLELVLSTDTNAAATDFYFNANASLGLDPGYDAAIFGGTAPAFSIYSHLVEDNVGTPFIIQTLGDTDYGDTTVALGVNAFQGEQLTFSISTNTLPATVDVYLDDTVASTSTLLNSEDYVMTPATDLSGTGRFYLRFMDSSLSVTENNLNDLVIYTNQGDRTIVIAGPVTGNTLANVYDMQGRLVRTQQLDTTATLQTITASELGTGIYIVELHNTNGSITKKIILK